MLKIPKEDLRGLYTKTSSFEELWDILEFSGYVDEKATLNLDLDYLFARIYKNFRVRAKHKGIHLISPGNRQWTLLMGVTEDAEVFCKEFSFSYREGFIKYLSIAQELGVLKLNSLRYNGDKISSYYAMGKEIEEDPHSDLTFRTKEIFIKNILIRYGVVEQDIDSPHFHIHFVRFTKECHQRKINPISFINIVFDIWAWTQEPLNPKNIHSEYTFKASASTEIPTMVAKKVTLHKGKDRYD